MEDMTQLEMEIPSQKIERQSPIFDVVKTSKRPERESDIVLDLAASKVVEELSKLFGQTSDEEKADIKSQLKNALEYESDVYKICRKLDNLSWDCDEEIFSIIEKIDKFSAYQTILKEWALLNKITPKYKINDIVSFTRNKESYSGVITSITDTGQYIIFCEQLGHKKVREAGVNHISTGTYVDFENVK